MLIIKWSTIDQLLMLFLAAFNECVFDFYVECTFEALVPSAPLRCSVSFKTSNPIGRLVSYETNGLMRHLVSYGTNGPIRHLLSYGTNGITGRLVSYRTNDPTRRLVTGKWCFWKSPSGYRIPCFRISECKIVLCWCLGDYNAALILIFEFEIEFPFIHPVWPT